MRRYFLSFALFLGAGFAQTPANMPKADLLWPGGAPGALGTEDIDKPSLASYLVPAGRGTGTAVIVCPGGGYSGLSMDKEGDQIARWLNSLGVSAFVLKYRLGPKYHHPVELGDAQPRSLAGAFRKAVPLTGDVLDAALAALAGQLEAFDAAYGRGERRAALCTAPAHLPDTERLNLAALAAWAAAAAQETDTP